MDSLKTLRDSLKTPEERRQRDIERDNNPIKDDDEIEEMEDDFQGQEENPVIKIDMNEIQENMEKWRKKGENLIEDINIFRYHARYAKALSTMDIANADKTVFVDRETVSEDDVEDDTENEESPDDEEEGDEDIDNGGNWIHVRKKRSRMRLKDYQLYIPRYNSETGFWMDASQMYERQQRNYIPMPGDWICNLCSNANFRRRRKCYNPNCGAPKGWRAKKVEKNSVTPFDGQTDPKKKDENEPGVSPEVSDRGT